MKTVKGIAVSTPSSQIISDVDAFHHQVISLGKHAADILETAKQHPEHPLIQTYAAIFYLFAQDDAATQNAHQCLLQAEQVLKTANIREKILYQAARRWLQNDFEGALTSLESLVRIYPQDSFAIKLAEWVFYCLGQAYSGQRFLHLCEQAAPMNQEDPYFLASHSFALELTGHYDKAQVTAEKGLEREVILPWAHHTIAHVTLLTQQHQKGITFLEKVQPTWDQVLPLLKSHNTWHLALFYLAKREEQAVVKLYHHGIFGAMPHAVPEQIDAISLLWRMDMAGLHQTKRLQDVFENLQHHPFEFYIGFNAIHFIYCVARSGHHQEAEDVLEAIKQHAKQCPTGHKKTYWQTLVLPFCQATVAFTQGNYKQSLSALQPIILNCYQLGGSDAQDELFLQMHLLCLIHCKKIKTAKAFFNKHLSHYRNTALEAYWFNGNRPLA